jgi:hypothetical protein
MVGCRARDDDDDDDDVSSMMATNRSCQEYPIN